MDIEILSIDGLLSTNQKALQTWHSCVVGLGKIFRTNAFVGQKSLDGSKNGLLFYEGEITDECL